MVIVLQVAEISGEQELILRLAGRACRDAERAEHNIHGLRNADLRRYLPLNPGQVSRRLKRLRVHGLIKRIGRTYKYYLTALGRRTLLAGLQIRQSLLPQVLMANS